MPVGCTGGAKNDTGGTKNGTGTVGAMGCSESGNYFLFDLFVFARILHGRNEKLHGNGKGDVVFRSWTLGFFVGFPFPVGCTGGSKNGTEGAANGTGTAGALLRFSCRKLNFLPVDCTGGTETGTGM